MPTLTAQGAELSLLVLGVKAMYASKGRQPSHVISWTPISVGATNELGGIANLTHTSLCIAVPFGQRP